jgi:hypothetical protein
MRKSVRVPKPVIHTPMRFDWTDEKLQALSQEHLLVLLQNLDHQRTIGRLSEGSAAAIDQRITKLLTGRSGAKRRKQVASSQVAASVGP